MIDPRAFLQELNNRGIDFFAGVPDSLLKNFLAELGSASSERPSGGHLVTANEGAAVAAACGYYLATGKMPLVYMQNSGLGNAVNPLLSLADRQVYGIPLLLLVGWRGEPGIADEPQHRACGAGMLKMLDCLSIPYGIIARNSSVGECLNKLIGNSPDSASRCDGPRALLVRKDAFASVEPALPGPDVSDLTRAEALEAILAVMPEESVYVSTTGYTSRELHLIRQGRSEDSERDFFNVGAMGHANQIALGIAIGSPGRTVVCLDGDGALLMHMGALAVIGNRKPPNLKHIVFNNYCHESVGGQPTGAGKIDFARMAADCGYASADRVFRGADLKGVLLRFCKAEGPALVEIVVQPGVPEKLPRPSDDFSKRKLSFMKFLSEGGAR